MNFSGHLFAFCCPDANRLWRIKSCNSTSGKINPRIAFSSTKLHTAELSQQKLPRLVTLRLEGKYPFHVELVLLVLCTAIVRPADALHEAPLLDRILVQHAEASTKQSEDLCTP